LDISRSNPDILYAIHDSQQESKEKKEIKADKISIGSFVNMSSDELLAMDDELLNAFLKEHDYPEKYTADQVKKEIRMGKYKPRALAEYFGDANDALFDTEILGAEVYRSDDGGGSWQKVNTYNLEGVFFTYGYYFGQIDVDPLNPEIVYIHGVPFLKSKDGGKTFSYADTVVNVHADHHALWINPVNTNHMLLGNDGGLYVTYDQGAHWDHINNTAVGQFYTVNVDMEKPYNVYGGLQDNGVLKGSSRSVPNETAYWEKIFGGDGMFVSADPANSQVVYTGFQFGNYYRLDLSKGSQSRITPQHDIGGPPLRFNWRTPVMMSMHNSDILYFASQYVHRSLNQGDDWDVISQDLTQNKAQGNVPFSTIVALVESPLKFELLYVGTDDGKVWVLKGAGNEWQDISRGLPEDLWVSSIYPSPHDQATVFVTLNGYRFDHFNTYVYMSKDYGESWQSISGDIEYEAANVIIQDRENPNLLFLGTDHGTYVSLNSGKDWDLLATVPNVANYDMIIHPRDQELVIATHGRSMYVTDIKPLQELYPDQLEAPIVAFSPGAVKHSEKWGEKSYPYAKPFIPILKVPFYTREAGELVVDIINEAGDTVAQLSREAREGFNQLNWDLSYEVKKGKEKGKVQYLDKGQFKMVFTKDGEQSVVELSIE
jgi:hypothetical protein